MQQIEVFADVGCPFAHAGLRTFMALRHERAVTEPRLWVRTWPLELLNGEPISGSFLAPEIEALQAGPTPHLFAGFDASAFPATMLPAMTSAVAAYRAGAEVGEAFSMSVRDALWERGLDISDPAVLAQLRGDLGVPDPTGDDEERTNVDLEEGRRRGVAGSPHFFTASGDFFCPSLDITHEGGEMKVTFDVEGFHRFVDATFA